MSLPDGEADGNVDEYVEDTYEEDIVYDEEFNEEPEAAKQAEDMKVTDDADKQGKDPADSSRQIPPASTQQASHADKDGRADDLDTSDGNKRKRKRIEFPSELIQSEERNEVRQRSSSPLTDAPRQGEKKEERESSGDRGSDAGRSPGPSRGPPGPRPPPGKPPRGPPVRPPGARTYYFGMRSNSLEHVLISVQTGLWATSVKNEKTLSNAFRSTQQQPGRVVLFWTAARLPFVAGYAVMKSDIGAVTRPSPFGTFPGKLFRVDWQLFGEFLSPLFQHVRHPWFDKPGTWMDGTSISEKAGDEMCAIMHNAAMAHNLAPPQAMANMYSARFGGPRPPAMSQMGAHGPPRPPPRPPQGMHNRLHRGESAMPAARNNMGMYGGPRAPENDRGRFIAFDDTPKYSSRGRGDHAADDYNNPRAPPGFGPGSSHLGMPPHLAGIEGGRSCRRSRSRSPERGDRSPKRRKHLSDLSYEEYLEMFARIRAETAKRAQPKVALDGSAAVLSQLLANPQVLSTLAGISAANMGANLGSLGSGMGMGLGAKQQRPMTEDEYVVHLRRQGYTLEENIIRSEYRKMMASMGFGFR